MRNSIKICSLILIFCWGAVFLHWPMGRDQGIFAWAGSVITSGGIPYKDAWEVKGPMAHLSYALVQLIFGQNQWGIRLFDYCLLLSGLFCVYHLAKQMSDELGGWTASVIFFAMYYSTGYWHTAQPDGWTAVILLYILYTTLQPGFDSSLIRPGLAGFFLGVVFLFKPLYLIFLPLFLFFLFIKNRWQYRDMGPLIITTLLSFSLPVVIIVLWYIHHDAFDSLLEIQFQFNPLVHAPSQGLSLIKQLKNITKYIMRSFMFVPLVIIGIVKIKNRYKTETTLLGGFFILSIFCVVLQAKYFAYHWHPVSGVIAIMSGIGLSSSYKWLNVTLANYGAHSSVDNGFKSRQTLIARLSQVLIVIILLSFFKLRLLRPTIKFAEAITGIKSWETYYKSFATRKRRGGRDFSYSEIAKVAEYLYAHTQQKDTVLVWGYDVLINYLSHRHSPTRFGYNYPLTRGPVNPLEAKYRQEFMTALKRSPPTYVVVAGHDKGIMMAKSSKELLALFDELAKYLETDYHIEKVMDGYELLRLNHAG